MHLAVVALERLTRGDVSCSRRGLEASDAVRPHAAHAGPTLGVETAEQLLVLRHQCTGVLGVRLRDNVAVVVLGDGEQPVQVVEVVEGGIDCLRSV